MNDLEVILVNTKAVVYSVINSNSLVTILYSVKALVSERGWEDIGPYVGSSFYKRKNMIGCILHLLQVFRISSKDEVSGDTGYLEELLVFTVL